MFGYIKGYVRDISDNYIVLDNNNIGYNIFVSNVYNYTLDNEYLVYTYNYVSDNEFSLYGFLSKEEKDMFLKLISVKGIGPKAGMSILSSSSVDSIIKAIEEENILYLKKIPKIGEKAARQIILDLKGKLVTKIDNKKNDELILALESLGYKRKDITKILSYIDNDITIEEQIKEALKLLLS